MDITCKHDVGDVKQPISLRANMTSATKPEIRIIHITTPSEEDRATATGNMHKNGEDRTCSSGDMIADGQTLRQTRSSQYSVLPYRRWSNKSVNNN